MESENSNESIKLLRKGLNLLSTQLGLEKTNQSENFLLEQLKMLGLLKFRIEFLADTASGEGEGNSSQAAADLSIRVLEEQSYQV